MISLDDNIRIALIHVDRMVDARKRIDHLFPIKAENIEGLAYEDLASMELYTSRFGKLQDLIGAKIFHEILKLYGENLADLSFIDRLNKLEQLEVIESAGDWSYMRKIHNLFSHEYPDAPEMMSKNLNAAYELWPKILDCLAKVEEVSKKLT